MIRTALVIVAVLAIPCGAVAAPDQPEATGDRCVVPEDYTYQVSKRRDPFRPVLKEELEREKMRELERQKKQVEEVKVVRVKEELENYSLESLKFVATMEVNKEFVAVVQDAANKAYTVRKNHYMGNNEGRITAIRRREIDLEEFRPTPSDPLAKRTITLKLAGDDQDTKSGAKR